LNDYEDKIARERRWHTEPAFRTKHFLNTRFFYSRARNDFNYIYPRKKLGEAVHRAARAMGADNPKILIAPLGGGADLEYIEQPSFDISGIDIHEEAVAGIAAPRLRKFVGDIKNMSMFSDGEFDIVAVPLFLHHFVRYGFDDYLREAHRVLKPGGRIIALEPSSLNPMVWATWLAKKIFGNITGTVDDEAAFPPARLTSAMKRCGFGGVGFHAAGFCHNRVPIPIAKFINLVTSPLMKLPVIKHFAWMCVFYGEKQP